MQKKVLLLCVGLSVCLVGTGCNNKASNSPPANPGNAQTSIPEETRQKAAQAAAEQARQAAAEQARVGANATTPHAR